MGKEQGKNGDSILEKEISNLRIIIETPLKSKGDRLSLEAKLNSVLPHVSNKTIEALLGNRYVNQEFEKRIRNGVSFDLNFIFRLAENLAGATFTRKPEKQLGEIVSQGIQNSAPLSDIYTLVDIVLKYGQSVLDANTSFLEEALSYRNDTGKIKKKVLLKAIEENRANVPDWYLSSLIAQADKLRAERFNKK